MNPWKFVLATLSLLLTAWPVNAVEVSARMQMHSTPRLLPNVTFKDADGRSHSLSDFRGRTVVLNVWATWCVPCREEMPALDRLQGSLSPESIVVVAVSMDRKGLAPVRKFFEEVGIDNLKPYIDESSRAMRELGLVGLPGTLLIDREGREIGRLLGGAEWDSPDAVAFLKTLDAGEREPASNHETSSGART